MKRACLMRPPVSLTRRVHLPHLFQIGVSVEGAGEDGAALRPFVPCVDEHRRRLLLRLCRERLRLAQQLPEPFRRIAHVDGHVGIGTDFRRPGGVLLPARRSIPAHGHHRAVGQRPGHVHVVPVLLLALHGGLVGLLPGQLHRGGHGGDVVGRHAVEPGRLHVRFGLGHATDRGEVHRAEARLPHLLAARLEERLRLLRAANLLDEHLRREDAEVGASVHAPVVLLVEVAPDAEIHHAPEILRAVADAQQVVRGLLVGHREEVDPAVVGPHQGVLDAVLVRRLRQGLLHGAVQELHAAVPVPVEDEDGDAVVGGGVYLAGHPLRVRLVEVAPGGLVRLVAGEPLLVVLEKLPLVPALSEPGGVMVVRVPGGEVDGGHVHLPPGVGDGLEIAGRGGPREAHERRREGEPCRGLHAGCSLRGCRSGRRAASTGAC